VVAVGNPREDPSDFEVTAMMTDQELNGGGADAVYNASAPIAAVETSGTRRIAVRGIELVPDDIRQRYREKIARITIDSMVQFVALLDAEGTVVDINQATLDAAGMSLSEVEGKPFWTTCWWQVSSEINVELRDMIARAARGAFARWETEIYERPGRRATIVIEASLTPVIDDEGSVAFICAEGRDITKPKALEGALGQKRIELQALLGRVREFDEIKARFLANIGHDLRTPLTLILGPAQRLIDAGTVGSDERRETGRVIVRNARLLLQHVNDLLNGSQLAKRGDMEGDRSTLAGVIEQLRSAAPKRRAKDAVSDAEPKPVVLVVEDNPDMNRFMAQCLSSHCDVICAFDGRDGLEKATRFRPALIVSDIMMPVMSGVEMIAEIRKRPELQTIPVLLLSATADEDLVLKLLDEGAQDFILKPFSEKDLLVRVRSLIAAGQVRAAAIHSLAREHAAREAAERQKHLIDKLRVAAESANRAKDEFLAMLGHELRNPLSPIVTALHLMKLQGADEKTERARTVIERQVNHLIRLVDDLLDVSRIARGKVELKSELVDMFDVVGKAIEMASPMLEQRAHALRVDVPRNTLCVDGDPTRLSQVVSNLLTNAAKYTPPGGQISVCAEPLDGEVVLRVQDSGIGIPPDVLPNIFDLFVQERQAIDRSQGGLGLGLTIVRSLVERHGGSVSALSEGTGRGSEFIVRLPKARNTRPETTADARPAATGAEPTCGPRTPRILLVDDNEDAAEMLAEALAQRGYPTRVAHDAPTALRLAAEFAPEIAFLDVGLPVMDGYELAAHLRALPGLANLRLIALTGYGQDSDRQRTRQAGFHNHLVKPVGIDDIEAAMTVSP
jgi:PAS domain S-box-containing protein